MIRLEHLIEVLQQPVGRIRLRDEGTMRRFRELAPRYREICNKMLGSRAASDPKAPGYDWSTWVASVRKAFDAGVPFGFLGHPVLRHTMVYGSRGAMKRTAYRVAIAREIFGDDVASRLLREDAIGRSTISSLRPLTSANRAHHAMHLAEYRRATTRDFWAASSFVEWGGGYGNMARLIRRMHPGVTYTIIDLPEISALQYIYLGSLEGEDATHIVDGDIRPGRVNFMSAYDLVPVQAEAFISTWALTESPADVQKDVAANDFFGAGRVLLASMRNENNALYGDVERLNLKRVPIPDAAGIGPGNEYWFR